MFMPDPAASPLTEGQNRMLFGLDTIGGPGFSFSGMQAPFSYMPQTPGFTNSFQKLFGSNVTPIQALNFGLGALNTGFGIYGGLKQLSLAKKSFQASRDIANANLANQTQSYNTALADKARARASVTGMPSAAVEDYITKNSLPARRIGG